MTKPNAPAPAKTEITTNDTVISTNDSVGPAPSAPVESVVTEAGDGTVITTYVGVQDGVAFAEPGAAA